MRLVLLGLFCATLLGAAPGGDRAPSSHDQCEQIQHENLLQENSISVAVHSGHAESSIDHGNSSGAVIYWRTAQMFAPGSSTVANSLGGAYLRMGKAAASAAAFARAVDLDRDNPAYHFNLANVEFILRHDLAAAWKMEMADLLRLALAEFREASRLSPNDLEYARAYAETFYGISDPDWSEAETAWKHVLSFSTERDFVYLHLARVRLKRGDANGARQFLNQIVDRRHDDLKRKLQAQADRL